MANAVQIGDKFTNGKEVATITAINPNSGRVKFQYNWQDVPSKYWTTLAYVLRMCPTKVEADEYDLGEWVPTGETLDEVIARDLAGRR